MEKIVLKFVIGLSPNATAWEKKIYRRYGKIANVCRQINYDIKQGYKAGSYKRSGSFVFTED